MSGSAKTSGLLAGSRWTAVFWLGERNWFGHLGASSDQDLASPGLLGVRWDGPAGGSTWGGPAAHRRPADGGATYVSRWWVPGGGFLKSECPVWF